MDGGTTRVFRLNVTTSPENISTLNRSSHDIDVDRPWRTIDDQVTCYIRFIQDYVLPVVIVLGIPVNIILAVSGLKTQLKQTVLGLSFFSIGFSDGLKLICCLFEWFEKLDDDHTLKLHIYRRPFVCYLLSFVSEWSTFVRNWTIFTLTLDGVIQLWTKNCAKRIRAKTRGLLYTSVIFVLAFVTYVNLTVTRGVLPIRTGGLVCTIVHNPLVTTFVHYTVSYVLPFICLSVVSVLVSIALCSRAPAISTEINAGHARAIFPLIFLLLFLQFFIHFPYELFQVLFAILNIAGTTVNRRLFHVWKILNQFYVAELAVLPLVVSSSAYVRRQCADVLCARTNATSGTEQNDAQGTQFVTFACRAANDDHVQGTEEFIPLNDHTLLSGD